jgi:hypothetical protein
MELESAPAARLNTATATPLGPAQSGGLRRQHG